jgi:hypothetical protein
MEYPPDFPEHLKRPVDAVIHAAEIAFIDAKQGIAPHRFQYEAERLILRYVEAVFFGFAVQAVQAGKEGVWNGERIRRALPEFLDDLGHNAYFDKHPNPGAYHASEQFKTTLNNKSKDWKGWRAIHEELRRVAGLHINFAGTPVARPIEASTPTPGRKTRNFREPNLELLKNQEGTLNRKNAAQALGVSERTLDRLVADKKLIPVGPGFTKRFKNKDLLKCFNKRKADKVDKSGQE